MRKLNKTDLNTVNAGKLDLSGSNFELVQKSLNLIDTIGTRFEISRPTVKISSQALDINVIKNLDLISKFDLINND